MTGVRTTVSSSEARTAGQLGSYKKLSPRFLAYGLRGRFNFRASGRNSCGSVNGLKRLKISELPSGALVPHNQLHCNSVSSCPHCRQRILSERGKEIQALIDYWLLGIELEMGSRVNRQCFLLTLTFPHYSNDTLLDLLGSTTEVTGLRGARSYLFGQSHFAAITRDWLIPAVNGIEVTYGLNGPHPHLHCLLFVDSDKAPPEYLNDSGHVDMAKLQALIYKYWVQSCRRAGLPEPHPVYGCDLRAGDDAGLYISKWAASHELSDSGGDKEANLFSESIADMERALVRREPGSERFMPRLSEYYNQMYGVRVHNFSRKLGFYRHLYTSTKMTSIVAREIGSGSHESSRFLNSAGPGYLDSIQEIPDLPLDVAIPDFQTEYGVWHLIEHDKIHEPKQTKAQFWVEFARRIGVAEQHAGKKSKDCTDRYKNISRYGRGNRWFIPAYGSQSESNN